MKIRRSGHRRESRRIEPTAMESFLRFGQVFAGYAGAPGVLQGIDLALASHEWLLVLGPNGAGKTTLLRTAVGWLKPLQGTVTLAGRPVDQWSSRERARLLGYLPQHPGGTFAFTVAEVVAQGLWHRNAPDPARVHRALETLHLAPLAHRPITALSGGERQLVFVARLLAQNPRFLLLDEPTAHLDPPHKLLLWQTLRDLRDQGIGGLVVTHDPVLPCGLFHRLVGLHRGRILWQVHTLEDLTPAHFHRLFGAPLQVVPSGDFCALLPAREGGL